MVEVRGKEGDEMVFEEALCMKVKNNRRYLANKVGDRVWPNVSGGLRLLYKAADDRLAPHRLSAGHRCGTASRCFPS